MDTLLGFVMYGSWKDKVLIRLEFYLTMIGYGSVAIHVVSLGASFIVSCQRLSVSF